jgi:integrase/recombinase XerD
MEWTAFTKSFQAYLKIERGLSVNTVTNYVLDVERLVGFLNQNNAIVSPLKISEELIQEFIYSVSKEVNPRTQSRIISGLKILEQITLWN